MALTPGLASAYINLTTGKFEVTDATSGPSYAKGVLRLTGPDGNLYYSPGNNAGTFAAPTTSTSPDFTAEGAINTAIVLPLDVNSVVQQGLYKIDYKTWDGTAVATYSGVLSVTGFTFSCFTNPTGLLVVSVNCSVPAAVFQDVTNYVINSVTPTIIRSALLTKNNSLPAPVSTAYATATYNLSGQFYAGYYSVTQTSTLVYGFTNFGVKTSITFTNTSLNVQCLNDCQISCAYNNLITSWQAAKAKGDDGYEKIYRDKLIEADIYISQKNLATKCGNQDIINSALTALESILAVSESCCNDANYQIVASGCDCKDPVMPPATASSTSDGLNNGYKVGDIAYDSIYSYRYDGIGRWTRNQRQTWI